MLFGLFRDKGYDATMMNARSILRVGALSGALLVLAACGGDTGRILGLEKTKPDEFAVVSRAPLTLPPDYGLRPPDPSGRRSQDLTPQLDAQRAVFGDAAVRRRADSERSLRASGASRGDLALMTQTGAIDADPGIRQVIDEESARLAAEDASFVDDLVFWKDAPESGDILDATEESRRIQDNNALGRPINEGQSPIITRDGEESFFEWPF